MALIIFEVIDKIVINTIINVRLKLANLRIGILYENIIMS